MVSLPAIQAKLEGAGSGRALEIALAGSVLALAIAICLPAIDLLAFIWSDSHFYGHAYAVPVVAGYFVFARRRSIARVLRSLEPPPLGPLVAFTAAALEVLMLLGDVGFAAGLGIPVVLAASAYAVGGLPLARLLAVPLCFVALIVPPPRFVVYELLFQLKSIVTHAAVGVLQAAGQTVVAEGNEILVPGHALFVADACSGLTSIVTMLPIACIIAYFGSRGVWRRAVVIASVVPLAIAANILRVVFTVEMVSVVGAAAAQGSMHEAFGVATCALGTLAVIGVARVLR